MELPQTVPLQLIRLSRNPSQEAFAACFRYEKRKRNLPLVHVGRRLCHVVLVQPQDP